MNKQTRKTLDEQVNKITEIKSTIESIRDDEDEKLNNLPEGLQESDLGSRLSDAVENLDSALESLDDAISSIEEATQL